MTVWLLMFLPIVATLLLLVFFRKHLVWWEILALIIPSALLILMMNTIMIHYNESDTEYTGRYITRVAYYEPWNEKVSCRHPIYCTRSYPCGSGKSRHMCSTTYVCGHHHAYDVDYHPEHWTKVDNTGEEWEISKSTYLELQQRFATTTYFVELNRNYHTIDGDAYYTQWNKLQTTSEVLSLEGSYVNKVKASKSIFKFEDISEKQKKKWALYDYPEVSSNYQPMVLGTVVTPMVNRKLQYLNGYYGVNSQFRMFILTFTDQSLEAAFKQRSYWEGGNKNEFVVCIGVDKGGHYKWCKAFSWMDKPELEVPVEKWFDQFTNKTVDYNAFADWMPKQIESHWKRKNFKDFDYLTVEVTETQLIWILIIIAIYNVCISIWVVKNEFFSPHH